MNYDESWFRSLEQYRPFNETAMLAVMAHLGVPDTMLDMGCGDGEMVRTAMAQGCAAFGIERNTAVFEEGIADDLFELIFMRDLSRPLPNNGHTYDLVMCLEVAEHLPESAADVFVENVASRVGKYLVFSAAAPGQGGDGHINCQPQEYWRRKFESKGLVYEADKTAQLQETWRWTTGPMFWLPQNLQVFSHV